MQEIIQSIKSKYPKAIIETGWYTNFRGEKVADNEPHVKYFVPEVIAGKVTITQCKRKLTPKTVVNEWFDKKYLTESDAREAIEAVLPKANEHFEKCKTALHELQNSMEFSVDYSVSGDTHGIEREYLYIEFIMDGFGFQYILNEY